MSWVRILTTSLLVALVTGACSGGSGPKGGGGSVSFSGRIAFSSGSQGAMDVYVANADGTGLRRLTTNGGDDFDPSWSPDGGRIAFRSERSGEPEIWVMNADGTEQRRLTPGLSPAWSPDGALIAFSGRAVNPDGTHGILSVIRPDGTGLRTLPHTEGGEYPSWSPDGTRIAFNSNVTGDHLMSIIQADGSKVVDLSRVGEGWQVAWSPDGRAILFASHRDQADPGYTDVYVMRPDGSGVRRLTHQGAYTPAWSPDDEHVVFSAPGLFVMNPDGTGVTPVPTEHVPGETMLPDWTE
jgi:Tol biopolymer transport system component